MKNVRKFIIGFLISLCLSCMTPKHFTNYYTGEYTGLDTLINTQGYYYFSACDGSWFHVIMFYTDGIFKYSFFPDPKVGEYTLGRMNGSIKDKTSAWGGYRISNDTIKTQSYLDYGPIYGTYIQFRDYLILPDKNLSLISEYMLEKGFNNHEYEETKYCNPSTFYYLETKADSTKSVLYKKRWFRGK